MAGLFSPSESQPKGLLGDFRGRAGLLGYVDQLNQKRADLNAEDRQFFSPWHDFDIPEEQQFVTRR